MSQPDPPLAKVYRITPGNGEYEVEVESNEEDDGLGCLGECCAIETETQTVTWERGKDATLETTSTYTKKIARKLAHYARVKLL